MRTRDRLRIAIQKSGRLSGPSRQLLAGAGLRFGDDGDQLFQPGRDLPVDLLLVRDDDIPGLIAEGVADLGVVGRNVLEEQALERMDGIGPGPFRSLRELGFGRCRLSLAVPADWDWPGPSRLQGLRIATSYPRLLERWLRERGIVARAVKLSGSVEIAPRLGTADAICDLVSTGATLAANRLREVERVLSSQAVLAAPARPFGDARDGLAAMLLRRLAATSRERVPA
ncbi:ATP phosphoribosyltransferase [Arenimonas fontis]|uniref:ATP phosphoribosyltransferase n=1 Tax=Arenimonas fontis TaxID=2608255 RepID=A0A5B2ZBK2_9GAMM|nr:ATP phosphoribosyltransferase [Arenimonas fontis]